MPKLSKDQQQQRQNAILAAAERCFLRRGFHTTTMQDICKEANVSAGAIYVYFRSKEALIAGLAALEQDQLLQRFSHLGESGDFVSGLEAMIGSCISEQTPEKTSFLLEIVAESTRNPELRNIIQRVDEAIKAKMVSHFERARRKPEAIPEPLLRRFELLLPVIMDGLMLRKALDPHFDQQSVVHEMLQFLRTQSDTTTAQNMPSTGSILAEA